MFCFFHRLFVVLVLALHLQKSKSSPMSVSDASVPDWAPFFDLGGGSLGCFFDFGVVSVVLRFLEDIGNCFPVVLWCWRVAAVVSIVVVPARFGDFARDEMLLCI